MKYIAAVEIEFETKGDPLETLQHIMQLAKGDYDQSPSIRLGGYADHCHIIEQPRELKK